MAARAAELGDVGESGPEHWEPPFGSDSVHVAVAVMSPDREHLEYLIDQARNAHRDLSGVEVIWQQDCYQLPTGRTSFGFKDGIGQPAIEGSGLSNRNPLEPPIKAGEFIFGYPDETGSLPPMPQPDVLGRNGTYIVLRKLHTRVAAYRRYVRERRRDSCRGTSARRQNGRTLAEWRAACARSRRRRSAVRRGRHAEQCVPVSRRLARVQMPGRRTRTQGAPARRFRAR